MVWATAACIAEIEIDILVLEMNLSHLICRGRPSIGDPYSSLVLCSRAPQVLPLSFFS